MSRKRIRSKEEITILAKRLRALWIPGEPLRPWLRRHAKTLLKFIRNGWSWEAVANALEEAGIKYHTEKAWTAAWLQSDFHRARTPLKGYARGRRGRASRVAANTALPSSSTEPKRVPDKPANGVQPEALHPVAPNHPADPAHALLAIAELKQSAADEPEFKFARFIDWDERRHSDGGQPGRPASSPPPPSQHYIEVMEQLTGKKPPY